MATHVEVENLKAAKHGQAPTVAAAPKTDPNTVSPTRARDRKKTPALDAEIPAVAARGPALPENSIRPMGRLLASKRTLAVEEGRRGTPTKHEKLTPDVPPVERKKGKGTGLPQASDKQSIVIPDPIRARFTQVGNRYYFADGAHAFTDRGRRLTTQSENTEVIRSLVSIAQARGWSEITVRGTDRFRKETWFAAHVAGLKVRGYQPSHIEQSHLIRTLAREKGVPAPELARNGPSPGGREADSGSAAKDERSSPRGTRADARDRRGGLLTGRLIDHGRATYHHDPREAMSYFVKIETPRGDRLIWGVDLERAFKLSLTQPQIGDEIGLRAVRQEAVKVKTHERDAKGNVIGEKVLDTHRNHWIVEKRGFFELRAEAARTLRDSTVDPERAVKRHPELIGTYLQMRAAELAARQFRDPEDQQSFVAKVRSALADAVARGEPLPPVRLREPSAERPAGRSKKSRDREQAPVRG